MQGKIKIRYHLLQIERGLSIFCWELLQVQDWEDLANSAAPASGIPSRVCTLGKPWGLTWGWGTHTQFQEQEEGTRVLPMLGSPKQSLAMLLFPSHALSTLALALKAVTSAQCPCADCCCGKSNTVGPLLMLEHGHRGVGDNFGSPPKLVPRVGVLLTHP